jgi:hypothetical protein
MRFHDSLNYDRTPPEKRTRAQRVLIRYFWGDEPYRGPLQFVTGAFVGMLKALACIAIVGVGMALIFLD